MNTYWRKFTLIIMTMCLLFPLSAVLAEPSEARRSTDLLADWLRKNGATDIVSEMNRTRLASSAYRALAKHLSTESKPGFTGEQYCKLLYEEQKKVAAIYISTLNEGGVTVRKGPEYYAEKADEFYSENPDLKKESCTLILKSLVIMEDDWEERNADRDFVARQWLGDELYLENRKRHPK